MNNTFEKAIPKRMASAMKNLAQSHDFINKCKENLDDFEYEKFQKSLCDATIESEKGYLKLRKLFAETVTDIDILEELNASEIDTSGIEITNDENGSICISMPIITPMSRLQKLKFFKHNLDDGKIIDIIYRTDAILNPLKAAINTFIENNKIGEFKECTIVYVNIFNKDSDAVNIPDTDSYSIKNINDYIASMICHVDDKFIDMMIKNVQGTTTHTKIFIIPRKVGLFQLMY